MTSESIEEYVSLEGGIEELPHPPITTEESIYSIEFLCHIDSQEFYGGDY